MSASTLRGWLDEQRLISEKNLRTLLEAKGLAEEGIQRWARPRELAQPQLRRITPADVGGTLPGAENVSRNDAGRRKTAVRLTPPQGAAVALIAVGLRKGWLIGFSSQAGTGVNAGTTTSGSSAWGSAAVQPTAGAKCGEVDVDLRPGSDAQAHR
ncbi:hypothetical protein [Nocardia sp. NRRL S-836]|uniref:hypothetical protein n=1 Tax=Nocardia sp. NRRL S-836 TaxID=1519492 RepID=UPI0006AED6A9|nr:hypothetical protein [Nocardia sp. NRRL S-836]KOV81831.1 hypothetical protein ADL03_27085 [Nocardia sp. NRRL S-836]